jgi:hypothetical protein
MSTLDRMGTPEQIASLLNDSLADPELRSRLMAAAPETARPFDTELVYAQFRAAHHTAYRLRATGLIGKGSP